MKPLRMIDESSDSQYQSESYFEDQSETECKIFLYNLVKLYRFRVNHATTAT